jgi:hypothetical protein
METLRLVNKCAEEYLALGNIPVLDKGYVKEILDNYYGDSIFPPKHYPGIDKKFNL